MTEQEIWHARRAAFLASGRMISHKRVDEVKAGDLLDLEGDKYADSHKITTAGRYIAKVVSVEPAVFRPGWISVELGDRLVLLPADHKVRLLIEPTAWNERPVRYDDQGRAYL